MRDSANPESVMDDWTLFLIAFAIFFFYSFFVEPNLLMVKRVGINDTGLDMKIVFMADFQRWSSDPAFVQRAVDLANLEEPDLILLGGDYVESSERELPSVEPLKSLHAKYGVYGVMGNHDYGVAASSGSPPDPALASDIRDFLENGGIRILGNENACLDGVTLIGLDDFWAGERDARAAFSGNISGYRILLSHNQEGIALGNSSADLYLFGHTHCGQIRLPELGSIPKLFGFSGEYEMGYYRINDGDVYTTCGLGWGPRFFAPPEVTVIELN